MRTQQINTLVMFIYFDYAVLARICSGKRVGEQHDPPRAAQVTFLSLSLLMFRQRCQVVEHSIFSQNSPSDDDDDDNDLLEILPFSTFDCFKTSFLSYFEL